ncbi:PH domain-containing protein [Sunxiuqinia rutila]|uniref:PH domain-containing protein n=1 Tax=Sunxiuqinia rutila TaxID=1397841 RepID=UPI003D35E671
MKKYRSKIGRGILLILVVVIGGTSALMLYLQAWPGLVVNLLVSVFIAYLFSTTYYLVGNGVLKVKGGFIVDKSIRIEVIREIRETHNPLAAPANSLDRLEIKYGSGESILISPKDKRGFILHLKEINPTIQFGGKLQLDK